MVQCFSQVPTSRDTTGTFTDSRDNQSYKWVKIGSQTWMAENLAYINSIAHPSPSAQAPRYYVYGYEGNSVSEAKSKDNYAAYGVLYNWKAATTACPAGWHLPTDEEWYTLGKSIGVPAKKAGKKLKSTSGWFNDGNGDNLSSFTALPGGYWMSGGDFAARGQQACFWSSSFYVGINSGGELMARTLSFDDGLLTRGSVSKIVGFSVRCVKDE
jgi:uncharacterized protein (TIGR02145 family)